MPCGNEVGDTGTTNALTLLAVGLGFLLPWTLGLRAPSLAQETNNPKISVDASFTISSGPSRARVTVEFYRRGPLPPMRPGQPDEYVRGIAVKETGVRETEKTEGSFRMLDRWEAPPTTITAFYPKLSRTWSVPDQPEAIITTAVQYGGRSLTLYAFTWDRRRLELIPHWDGENFSIAQMGAPPRFVVTVMPADYNQIPQLYAWNGSAFLAASEEFPRYFRTLGNREAATIYGHAELPPPGALVQSCRRALQAYALADQQKLGRKACVQARARIESASHVHDPKIQQERESAIAEINRLLKGNE
jgi:hypothetical protein